MVANQLVQADVYREKWDDWDVPPRPAVVQSFHGVHSTLDVVIVSDRNLE